MKEFLGEIGFDDGGWKELDQDCVQWQVFLLVVLNLWVLLPQC
jgi:hypothetical protein